MLLIVGIDPGTSTAFAALTIKGEVVKVWSKRNISLSIIIKELSALGRPVIISCDKHNPPRAAELIASRFNARLVVPPHDLKVG